MQKQEQRIRINRWIKSSEVKVVGSDGSFLGIMNTQDAIKLAQEQNLDLVEINSKVYPPLTRIVNFGKFKYEEKKKQTEEKKKQKVSGVKEIFCRPNTQDNDLNRLVEQAKKFLLEGYKVRFGIKFRGREMAFKQQGEERLKWVLACLNDIIASSTSISLENRNMSIVICPKSS